MIESGLFRVGNVFIGLEYLLLAAFVLIAAIGDIRSRRIPNWLVLSGIITSLIYQTYSGYGYGFIFWLGGICVGFISLFPLYVLRAMGAGDVKLMALVGSFLGWEAVLQTLLLTLVSGGVLSLLIIIWNRNWKLVFENIGLMSAKMTIAAMNRQMPKAEAPLNSAGNLPYAVAIAAGTMLYICFFRP